MKAAISAFSIIVIANQLAQPGYACESDADCSCVNGLCIDTDQVVCGMISDLVCNTGVIYPPCHCDMSSRQCRKTCPPDEHKKTKKFDSPVNHPTLPPQVTIPPFGEFDESGTAGTGATVGGWFDDSGTAGTGATVGSWFDDSGTAGTGATVGATTFHKSGTGETAGSPFKATDDADVCIAVESSGSTVKFHDAQVFASSLVERLDEQMPGYVNFSLVQFADESSIQSELTTAKTAIEIVSDLTYTSGMTNTEAALISCQSTLANSNLKKYIILLTDGVPTTSDKKDEPFGAALAAADEAKTEDIFIIEAYIEPLNDDSEKEVMMEICSGESLYNVADFDDFDAIVDAVAEPVLYAMDNSNVGIPVSRG